MLNRDGSHHQHFEELCALAAGGQISEPEFIELQGHLQQCAHCRSTYSDFIDLLHDKLPLADPEVVGPSRLSGFFSEDSSYRERFLARARKEGLNISRQPLRDTVRNKLQPWFWPRSVNARLATLAVAMLFAAVGLLGYDLYKSNARYRKLASDQAELSKQLSRQSGHLGSVHEENNAADLPHNTVPTTNTSLHADTATEVELAKIRADRAAAELALRAYRAAGAEVVELSASPDGWNINDGCGSTHLEPTRAAVVAHGASVKKDDVLARLDDTEQRADCVAHEPRHEAAAGGGRKNEER